MIENPFAQFVREGVLIPDISCAHASPFVIVHKRVVDFREVNQFLRVPAYQLPYQDILF